MSDETKRKLQAVLLKNAQHKKTIVDLVTYAEWCESVACGFAWDLAAHCSDMHEIVTKQYGGNNWSSFEEVLSAAIERQS